MVAALLGGCGAEGREAARLNPLLNGGEPYGVPARPERSYQPFTAQGFNAFIINAAKTFGPGAYLWQGDGVTRKILYQGTLIAQPYQPGVCHCVGATFQVYMSAFEAWDKAYGAASGSLRGLTAAQVKQLRTIWYVSTSDEAGSAAALAAYKLGTKVTAWTAAQQGDVVQLWRNNGSGHSVIFDHWLSSGGKTTGIAYFSCQSSGPGFVSETIGTGAKEVDAARIYIGHPAAPVDPPDAAPTLDGVSPDQTPAASDVGPMSGEGGPRPDQSALPPPYDPRGASDTGCSCQIAGGGPTPTTPLLLTILLGCVVLRRARGMVRP